MRWILAGLLFFAAPCWAQETKPLKQSDFDSLRIIDLEAAVARERFQRFGETFRAEILRLQIQDGTTGCQLSQEKKAWVCPEPPKPPKPKKD